MRPPHACLCPKPGSPVYSSKCENCVCTNTVDSSTQLNVITCTHVPCNSSCSPVSHGTFHSSPCLCLPSSHLPEKLLPWNFVLTASFLFSLPTCACLHLGTCPSAASPKCGEGFQ